MLRAVRGMLFCFACSETRPPDGGKDDVEMNSTLMGDEVTLDDSKGDYEEFKESGCISTQPGAKSSTPARSNPKLARGEESESDEVPPELSAQVDDIIGRRCGQPIAPSVERCPASEESGENGESGGKVSLRRRRECARRAYV